MVIWLLAGLAAAIALAYRQAAATLWLGAGLVWLAAGYLFNAVAGFGAGVVAVLVVLPALLLTIKPLRRTLLTSKALGLFRGIMPAMSDTERAAIESGTVWWDAELFSGKPHQRSGSTRPTACRIRSWPQPRNTASTACRPWKRCR